MCDTFVVVSRGEVLFGKNSDRDPNEAQLLDWQPRRESAPGAELRCTWSVIPEARRTWATLLSRPYWMWGAEMGANEHGVVIGNEAVFTRAPSRDRGSLLGMDVLRLALERAESGEEAVAVIRSLVETHGQGGRAGYDDPAFHYDSSFLVADGRGAWVVETAGRDVAIAPVASGARAISNGLTIEPFARRYADTLRGGVAQCRARRGRVERLAADSRTPRDVARVLRDHGEGGAPRYRAINGAMSAPCMHAGGLVASSQTVASWISRLAPARAEHFATATAAPCLSGFKPVALDRPIDLGSPTGVSDERSPFWRFERLHRGVIGDPNACAEVASLRDAWEAPTWTGERTAGEAFASFDAWLEDARARIHARGDRRPAYVRRVWQRADEDARAHTPKLPAWRG